MKILYFSLIFYRIIDDVKSLFVRNIYLPKFSIKPIINKANNIVKTLSGLFTYNFFMKKDDLSKDQLDQLDQSIKIIPGYMEHDPLENARKNY
jgi:hypothetical protein